LINLILGNKENSLNYQLNRLTLFDRQHLDFDAVESEVIKNYHVEYKKVSGGRIAFVDVPSSYQDGIPHKIPVTYFVSGFDAVTRPLLEPNEYALLQDSTIPLTDIRIDRIASKLYGARIGYCLANDPQLMKELSINTMVKPCYVYPSGGALAPLMTVILPFNQECNGLIEVNSSSVESNANDTKRYNILSAILEYPANLVRFFQSDTLFLTVAGAPAIAPAGAPTSVNQAFTNCVPYLPYYKVETSGILSNTLVYREDPNNLPTVDSKPADFTKDMHLVSMLCIADIVVGVVGFINDLQPPNVSVRLMEPRPSYWWTLTPLRAQSSTEGAMYVLPSAILQMDSPDYIFLPAVETDMFLASFFIPLLQLEWLQRFEKALLHNPHADTTIIVGGATSSRRQALGFTSNNAMSGIDPVKIRNLTVEGLSINNCEKFRNALIAKIGTSLAVEFNDTSLGFLDDIDLDRESILFLSEQKTSRSLRYGVTFNGYMNLFRRRSGLLGKIITQDTTTLKDERATREKAKNRAEAIAVELTKTNRNLDDADSQFFNELV